VTPTQIEAEMAARTQLNGTEAGSVGPVRALRRALPADYALLMSAAAQAPANATPRRSQPSRRIRCVPAAYAVGAAALETRLDPTLKAALPRRPADGQCGAVFLGPTGCGKSSAAALVVQRWLATVRPSTSSRRPVVWLDALEATDAEKRYKLGSGDPEVLIEASRADWLVIDDIGLSTSATLVQLVMARRYAAGLATIATTGLTRVQLSEHIGAATVRRILEFRGQKGLLVDCHGRRK
jgi:hypothetical protein